MCSSKQRAVPARITHRRGARLLAVYHTVAQHQQIILATIININ
jgi:hypothetical protein